MGSAIRANRMVMNGPLLGESLLLPSIPDSRFRNPMAVRGAMETRKDLENPLESRAAKKLVFITTDTIGFVFEEFVICHSHVTPHNYLVQVAWNPLNSV
jgi:hypothetical protein